MTAKAERKLQQQLNRIANCMIGQGRIHVLDRLAMECDFEADQILAEPLTIIPGRKKGTVEFDGRAALKKVDKANRFLAEALWLRRFEYDLWSLLEAVQNTPTSRADRYGIERGDRP